MINHQCARTVTTAHFPQTNKRGKKKKSLDIYMFPYISFRDVLLTAILSQNVDIFEILKISGGKKILKKKPISYETSFRTLLEARNYFRSILVVRGKVPPLLAIARRCREFLTCCDPSSWYSI